MSPLKTTRLTFWMIIALLIPSLSEAVRAQVGMASLKGLVTDASGAVVPNAAVTLESVVQQFTRDTVTDSSGEYVIRAIPPGTYKLLVKASGFKPEAKTSFILSALRKNS